MPELVILPFILPEVQAKVISLAAMYTATGLRVLVEKDPSRSDEFLTLRWMPPVPQIEDISNIKSTIHSDRLFHSIIVWSVNTHNFTVMDVLVDIYTLIFVSFLMGCIPGNVNII